MYELRAAGRRCVPRFKSHMSLGKAVVAGHTDADIVPRVPAAAFVARWANALRLKEAVAAGAWKHRR